MSLTLTIANETQLPDGGPLQFRLAGARGADIGREPHLDWTLPDPSRVISGKHCEIRYREGAYWLSDVSTNGTFLNDGDRRMQSPHRLRQGDRLTIGHYIIAVEVDGADAIAAAPVAAPEATEPEDLWGGAVGAAPPLDPRALRPASQSVPVKPDFLEWAVDVPNAPGVGFVARSVTPPPPAAEAPPTEPSDWAAGGLPQPPAPATPPPVPTPRSPIWINPGPSGPWDARAEAAPAAAPRAIPPSPRAAEPPAPRAEPPAGPQSAAFLQRFAKGAGLPPGSLDATDPEAFAEDLGRLMRLVADNLKQLLAARSQAKRIARTASQTMVQALDNTPLKVSPTAIEALRVLFGPRTGSYLDADRALQQSFDDLKAHQIKTFSAMQQAVRRLVEDLDPKAMDDGLKRDQGLAALIGSRKAQLWDLYNERWTSKTAGREGGLLDLYLMYFAEAYDRAPEPAPKS